MATLTLRRSKRWLDYGRWRKLLIQVEDGLIIPLRSGEENTLTLAPGTYELVAGMDFARSEPLRLEIKENDAKLVAATSRLTSVWLRIPPYNFFRLEEVVSSTP